MFAHVKEQLPCATSYLAVQRLAVLHVPEADSLGYAKPVKQVRLLRPSRALHAPAFLHNRQPYIVLSVQSNVSCHPLRDDDG